MVKFSTGTSSASLNVGESFEWGYPARFAGFSCNFIVYHDFHDCQAFVPWCLGSSGFRFRERKRRDAKQGRGSDEEGANSSQKQEESVKIIKGAELAAEGR